MVKAKYQSVLDLGEQLNIQDGDVQVKGNQLEVRGYIGIPAIGRSQIWERTNDGKIKL